MYECASWPGSGRAPPCWTSGAFGAFGAFAAEREMAVTGADARELPWRDGRSYRLRDTFRVLDATPADPR